MERINKKIRRRIINTPMAVSQLEPDCVELAFAFLEAFDPVEPLFEAFDPV